MARKAGYPMSPMQLIARISDEMATKKEAEMDRPDLYELAREVHAINHLIHNELRPKLAIAYEAAMGKVDEDDNEIEPCSGDSYMLFEKVKDTAWKAESALDEVTELLATAQGYRDFIASEAVEQTW